MNAAKLTKQGTLELDDAGKARLPGRDGPSESQAQVAPHAPQKAPEQLSRRE